jgi:pilus assembly protein CpaE
MFAPGLKKSDIEQTLGDAFAATIPNNYRLVREAIDRGVPLDEVKQGNGVTTSLKKLLAPHVAARAAGSQPASLLQKFAPAWVK